MAQHVPMMKDSIKVVGAFQCTRWSFLCIDSFFLMLNFARGEGADIRVEEDGLLHNMDRTCQKAMLNTFDKEGVLGKWLQTTGFSTGALPSNKYPHLRRCE
jgi:hypothetical protein